MRICNLASGSTGNCTYVEANNLKILIDLGKTKRYLEDRLREIEVNPNDIDYVLLTHTHNDHTSALKTFLKKKKAILVITQEMYSQLEDIDDLHLMIYEDDPNIPGLDIKSFKMSHDAGDTRAFVFNENNKSLVYITDTGYINSRYLKQLYGKTAYFIECNHDIEMLTHGPYPEWLQQRVLSDVGHLSNKFTGIYLSKLISPETKEILLMHLSEKNNTEECALETVNYQLNSVDTSNIEILCAKPNEHSKVIVI